MLYIKYTDNYLEYFDNTSNFPIFFKKIVYTYKKIFGKITKLKCDYGEVWLVPNKTLKFKKSLLRNLKIYHVKTLVLSKNLEDFGEVIKEAGIKILDGKWLYKYLLIDIIKFICKNKNVEIAEQTISFAVNKPEDVDIENLKLIARNVKSVNLITKEDYKFKRLEETMYEEEGIALNIAYNYKKSFLKSDIIINIDLSEKEFNKFSLPRKTVIINTQNVKILNKGFNGINILKYEIVLPQKYENEILNIKNFNKEVLYESFIYKKTLPKNVLNCIKKDELQIATLLGINGYIDKKEFSKV